MKNKKTILVIAIVVLLVFVVGISYAIFSFSNASTASINTINSGKISMSYTEATNGITITGALPTSDKEGMENTDYFDFSVMTNATTNSNDEQGVVISYDIIISPTSIDSDKTALTTNQIKFYLTKIVDGDETGVAGPALISSYEETGKDDIAIYSTFHNHKQNNGAITRNYRLRAWIDENIDSEDIYNCQYKFKVNVNANSDYKDLVASYPNLLTQASVKRFYAPVMLSSSVVIPNDITSSYCFATRNLADGTVAIDKYLCNDPDVILPSPITITKGTYVYDEDVCPHNMAKFYLEQEIVEEGLDMTAEEYAQVIADEDGTITADDVWEEAENNYSPICEKYAEVIEDKDNACEVAVGIEYNVAAANQAATCEVLDEQYGDADQYFYDAYGFRLYNIGAVEITNKKTETKTVSVISTLAFVNGLSGMGIKSLSLPNTVTTIGENAFFDNDLTSLTLPSSIQEIGNYAFKQNKITSLDFRQNPALTEIGSGAFSNNLLTSLKLSPSITTFGSNPFYIGGYANTSTISNPGLVSVVNPTGNSFDWANVFGGTTTSATTFETGTYLSKLGTNVVITDK